MSINEVDFLQVALSNAKTDIEVLQKELLAEKSARMVERKLLEELNDSHLNRDHGERGEDDSLTGDTACDWWEKKPCICFLSRDRKLDLPPAPDVGAIVKRLVRVVEAAAVDPLAEPEMNQRAKYHRALILDARSVLADTEADRKRMGL